MIFNGVAAFNEYRLPDRFAGSDLFIYVGGDIGAFAYGVVPRGSEHICSLEPDATNCAIAAEHLRPYIEKGYVRLMQRAVWRSDPNDDELRFDGYHPFPKSFKGMEGILNTGDGSVIWGVGEPVAKVAFDDLVDMLTNRGERRVRLLKLDCEGAEWPIVLTSLRLELIDEIVGEFHEIGGPFLEIAEDRPSKARVFDSDRVADFSADEFARCLREAGFRVTYRRHRRPDGAIEGFGLFFATREHA